MTRRSLRDVFPKEFSTLTVPKLNELVATPVRHGSKKDAADFFLDGMTNTFKKLLATCHPTVPITIYYAFKQSETKDEKTSSTGWETFLESIIRAGFMITGTWPVRTEKPGRMRDQKSNALASSIVLVCRKRDELAKSVSRREFIREIGNELPEALIDMTIGKESSPIAPVDLSQAIIGPGMAIFSKYSAVIEANGSAMDVKTALQIINRFLTEDDFDHDTQFCIQWFEANRWDANKFGEADVLARAKGTSVDGLKSGGILSSTAGKINLIHWKELPDDWDPNKDERISVWEILHHMIKVFNEKSEANAGEILSKTHEHTNNLRILAYKLYTLCERKKWAEDAMIYNNLILAWDSIEKSAQDIGVTGSQRTLFDD